jgi:serine/threonine protein kinase
MFEISTKEAPRLDSKKWSPQFCDFVEKCLQKDPSKRSSCEDLLKHTFL